MKHQTIDFGRLDISSHVGSYGMKCMWYNVKLMICEGSGNVYTLQGQVYDAVGSTLASAAHKKLWMAFRPAEYPDHPYYVIMHRSVDGWEHDEPWVEQ